MGNNLLTSDQNIRAAVLECSLFKHFAEENVDQLLARSRLIELDEGEYLIQQGEFAGEFFLVLEGELKLATSSSSGQEKILHILTAGQTFAEVLVFLGKPKYPAGVEALSRSRVVAFPSGMYRALLKDSIEACFGLLGEYALRNRRLVSEIEALTLYNATFRVVQYLLREVPEELSGAASVQLKAPKNVIASRLAITPETLSRILSKLKRDGVIQVSDKQVTLMDIDWLRNFLEGA